MAHMVSREQDLLHPSQSTSRRVWPDGRLEGCQAVPGLTGWGRREAGKREIGADSMAILGPFATLFAHEESHFGGLFDSFLDATTCCSSGGKIWVEKDKCCTVSSKHPEVPI
jgi:hypothetical protein